MTELTAADVARMKAEIESCRAAVQASALPRANDALILVDCASEICDLATAELERREREKDGELPITEEWLNSIECLRYHEALASWYCGQVYIEQELPERQQWIFGVFLVSGKLGVLKTRRDLTNLISALTGRPWPEEKA